MKNKAKIFRNLIFFIVLIALTLYLLLKDQSITMIFEILGTIKLNYVAIGIICMILYLACEAINIGRTLRVFKEKSTFFQNFKYALIGFFFSSITPAASGGQPMQIYYMHKDNISISTSTLALLINLSSMQVITLGFAFISLIFNYKYLNNVLIIFFIIGVSLNLSALALLLIGIFSRRMSRWLINIAIKIMNLLKVKNVEQKVDKIELELTRYQESAVYIKNHKVLALRILATTAIQFILFYSVSYWTYLAFGLNTSNIFEIITMQAVLYATVSGIPSPGAVGVSEGAFTEIFRNIYPQNMITSSVLLSRGTSFYLFVIISGIVVMFNHIRCKDIKEDNYKNID